MVCIINRIKKNVVIWLNLNSDWSTGQIDAERKNFFFSRQAYKKQKRNEAKKKSKKRNKQNKWSKNKIKQKKKRNKVKNTIKQKTEKILFLYFDYSFFIKKVY